MEELLEMSTKELDRLHILRKIVEKSITQKQAAKLLKLSDRQIRNLLKKLVTVGAKGLISKHRNKPSNHSKPKQLKHKVLELICNQYVDCGPTFIKEKLEEWHNIKISVETIRLWMCDKHLWIPRLKRKKIHYSRPRRQCFGELIQADGSHHHWFGEENPICNATVLIDDATSIITAIVFSEGETLNSYFQALEQHLMKYGRPRALYTDQFSIFKSPRKAKDTKTQMNIALDKLEIELILASSPQAKGRVERANRVLQDRLLKEMKLRGIKTITEANEYAKKFIEIYNKRFSKKPMSNVDAHRPLEGYDLQRILCRYETRSLSSSLSFQFNKKFYQVQEINEIHRLTGQRVEIRVTREGEMRVFLKNRELSIKEFNEIEETPILSRKEVLEWKPKSSRSRNNHPWKRYRYQWGLKKKIDEYERRMV
jgi:molybdenum-dependent DNA-binding transcriptional regulator ModE